MKEEINVFDYSNKIMKQLSTGILLTTKSNGITNSMTISWGALTIEWGKQIFTVFVRENRFTKKQLDENPEFTINIPLENYDKKILGVCGTKSGYNTDKIKELNLTLEESDNVSVPGIKELPLTLECKVIYKQMQDKNAINDSNKLKFYPQDIDSSFHGANKDYHIAYYGEILSSYIIK